MSAKHTPGPLFVSVENSWPFNIITKNAQGKVVFRRDMPSHSTDHKSAADALAGKGLAPEWNAADHNQRALADEIVRAAAPELLEALEAIEIALRFPGVTAAEVLAADSPIRAGIRAAIAKATGSAA